MPCIMEENSLRAIQKIEKPKMISKKPTFLTERIESIIGCMSKVLKKYWLVLNICINDSGVVLKIRIKTTKIIIIIGIMERRNEYAPAEAKVRTLLSKNKVTVK